ncbi:hypothetical protein DC522_24700 [Microvirga sp. KLBC 81]|uniref:recombinase family protein n=1 Tax=Microvirga sp. KLBC 81 TaxID=1862707 RepID=UPI000D51C43B|nr:hypothetical protein DC522_24700 [Microvirga sp. KLBC 81]
MRGLCCSNWNRAKRTQSNGSLRRQGRRAGVHQTKSERKDERPAFEQALALCRKRKAKLVIAKLDRLSRNLVFIARLIDAGVEFIAERTRAALQAAKARGTRLGRHGAEQLAPATGPRPWNGRRHWLPWWPRSGFGASSLQEIAAGLNTRGIPTPKGGQWSVMPVKRVLERV